MSRCREFSLLIEIERLKLALSHVNKKECLLNKLLEQKDNGINALNNVIDILKDNKEKIIYT
jgi:DNA-binding helix-turn-helix protein